MTAQTTPRPARVRWKGDSTNGPLHAIVNGEIAGTLTRFQRDRWTLTEDTIARYPVLYGIGPRALSTWRAKLALTIRTLPALHGEDAAREGA